MMMLAIITMLVGAVLGIRFKVLVLVPALVFGIVPAAVLELVHGGGWQTTLFAMAACATALQMGYLLGATTRFVLASMRVSKTYVGTAFEEVAH